MNHFNSDHNAPSKSPTGLTRRTALSTVGGLTATAFLAAGSQADRVMAQDATTGVSEPLFTEWAAAWEGDTARVVDIYAANAVGDDFATGEHFEGVDAISSHIEVLNAGIPNLTITLTSGFICGNRAALEYLVGSDQQGGFLIAAIFELADTKIVREGHYWNPALPAPGAATPTS